MEKSAGFSRFRNFVEASPAPVQQQQALAQPQQAQRGTYNTPCQWLDFDKLYDKAFKLTYPGNGSDQPGWAGVDKTPEDWSYSIVTPGNGWDWPEKRSSIARAKADNILNVQGSSNNLLDDEKYRQIVDTAKRLGL